MKGHQKIVAIIYAVVVFILTFFLMPWSTFRGGGSKLFKGFSPIWAIPYPNASPDISILLTELISITVIAVIVFVILQRK